ncbi:MAG: deaminase [Parcubacteria group bacterium]
MTNTIVAYVPVIHRGYLEFFREHGKDGLLLIPDKSITDRIEYIWRDMRALSSEEIIPALDSFGIFSEIRLANMETIIVKSYEKPLIMPMEDISLEIAKFIPEKNISFHRLFLRWNNFNVLRQEEVFWDREMDKTEFLSIIVEKARYESERSSDWWRQIGAVAFRDGEILIFAHNCHLPTELEPYYSGDPRTVFHAGEHIEFSTSIHAEAALVAKAAKTGISLKGAEIFVDAFPCPPCANLLSRLDIKTLYVAGGYSRLDAKRIFAEKGIEIVKLKETPI